MDKLNNHPALVDSSSTGLWWQYRFANNYGASVITSGYGNDLLPYELVVLKFNRRGDWKFCYDTLITDNVVGYLTEEDVLELLDQIEKLPQC